MTSLESLFYPDVILASKKENSYTMNLEKRSILLHKKTKGKLEIKSRVSLKTLLDLSLAYTPGVAGPSRIIAKKRASVYDYTNKGNTIAVITDGSAVLGLGNIGPEAALPVMEGKCILFKEFSGIDAIPICLATQNVPEIVKAISLITPSLGGINLEDISSPRCFLVEEKLRKSLSIPVFHDDQHGTAVVVLAATINALKIVKKKLSAIKIVINGAGAAGIATAKFLHQAGAKNIILCDRKGTIHQGRKTNMNFAKKEIASITHCNLKGDLRKAMRGADLFIGVSAPNLVNQEMVKSMAKNSIVFAMANPDPEIMPKAALSARARIVGTGRSDFPNQINNLLVFPGILRGALDARAKQITEEMKLAAALAIAKMVKKKELREDYIIPSPLNKNVAKEVAQAVFKVAKS